jgi:predicted PurR-regulated permease PerM
MTAIYPHRDLVRTILAALLIGILIISTLWVLRPFLPALIWATMVVVATWPIMLQIQKRLWGKRGLAVTVMTGTFLLLFVIPFGLAVVAIVGRADEIVGWSKSLASFTMPLPPDWLERLPIVGTRLVAAWQKISAIQTEELTGRLSPYVGDLVRWFVSQVGGGAVMFVQFLLTIAIAAVLYSTGEKAAVGVNRFARRMAGERGEEAAALAARAIRAVALGVIVTALIQSVLAGIGLSIAGIPYAPFLTALVFMLVVAQLGPAPVMIPAVIWLYWKGSPGWGTVLLIWAIVVGVLDNFLRPILIKRGADLSLLIVFVGVIGGLMAFGVIGIFIGPAVLGVSYTLLSVWVNDPGVEAAEPAQVIERG